MIIQSGTLGADYSQGQPTPAQLAARQITFVGLYLKYGQYWGTYAASLLGAGVGIIPIGEGMSGDALGGVRSANIVGPEMLNYAATYGVEPGTPIVFTHDTSAYTAQVPLFFQRLALLCHDSGYGLGGYVTKRVVDDCSRLGVTFDLITVPSGYKMNGDQVRPSQAHVWQQLSNHTLLPGFNVDPLMAQRPFRCWGTPVLFRSSITQLGTDTMKFVYNSDNPTDPNRYMTNGFVYRHVTPGDADAFADQCTNTVATASPLTTVEFYAMVDVTK